VEEELKQASSSLDLQAKILLSKPSRGIIVIEQVSSPE
jgi:hypothetical protein